MPYIVNPNDPTTPTNDQGATQGAEELRALKAVIAGLVVAALAAPAVRHAIQSANVDATGFNNALTVGAGLRPGLTAAVGNEYQLSTAAGFSGGKGLDFNESFNANVADILGADLPLNNTSFLFRNYGVGWGSTLIPPQDGYTFDRTAGSLLNFEGLNGAVATTDDFGNPWTFGGNAQLSTAQFKFGASSLLLDGTGDFVNTANIVTVGVNSWEISLWFRINALPGVGNAATLFAAQNAGGFGIGIQLLNTAGTTKTSNFFSSNGTAHDIANAGVGTNTVWTLNQWNKIRIVFDALSGTYKVYLSLNGALETTDFTVGSALRIAPFTTFRTGTDYLGNSGFNGWVDAFRFLQAATNTSAEVPSAVAPTIADYKYNFLSIPAMKMFEVTAASSVANTNPILTAANRLFVGEADTSGAAVTAIRNYAIRGRYDSGFTNPLPAGAVRTAKNHNLGTQKVKTFLRFRNLTPEAGFTPGQEFIYGHQSFDGANVRNIQTLNETRNVCSFTVAATGYTSYNQSTGVGAGITAANWGYKLVVERDY